MKIKEIIPRIILNSRKEKAIEILLKSENFSVVSSAPEGKSKGKYETKDFLNGINGDIKIIKKFSKILEDVDFNEFEDLTYAEEIFLKKIGANSLYALESAILKAISKEKKIELWQVINKNARKLPYPVGNCIGGGKHTKGKKPDFQEFLVIPMEGKFSDNVKIMNEFYERLQKKLSKLKAKGKFNDENAFSTSLGNEQVLKIMDETRKELAEKIKIGIDAAASSFYESKSKKYEYKNPKKKLLIKEQVEYIEEIIAKFDIFYIEDPVDEEDFESFSKLINRTGKNSLIVGDDLTVSNLSRLQKAINEKSINALIVKPNQNGSLLEIKKLVELAKKNNIKTIFSHRSGETMDDAISDLAFGFQADFVKFGVKGKEREAKLNRLVKIEQSL